MIDLRQEHAFDTEVSAFLKRQNEVHTKYYIGLYSVS